MKRIAIAAVVMSNTYGYFFVQDVIDYFGLVTVTFWWLLNITDTLPFHKHIFGVPLL